ncbi:MAG: hypothetical protein MUF66_12935 [Gammaproteobacteria bacterium]|nr:hypothetical protein [Gammaproteobacteria bacterium]
MDPGADLLAVLDHHAGRLVPGPELTALAEAVRRRHGDALLGILFYGSCLRSGNPRDGLVDLYVVVDRYRPAYRNPLLALCNRLLPPNVFYLELPVTGGRVRCKYALFSRRHLLRGTSPRWFQSYLWGRLAQPAAVLYARDPAARADLVRALGQAVVTFLSRVLPAVPERFTPAELWDRGLTLSYGTELRAERAGRTAHIVDSDPAYYGAVTPAALLQLPWSVDVVPGEAGSCRVRIPAAARQQARRAWALRRVQGKLLSVLRLAKAAFTFQGGVDYLLWKLERHSGVRVEASERERRHPLIFGWGLVWRLYRRGAFR